MDISIKVINGYWGIFYNYELLIPIMEAYSLEIIDSAIGVAWSKYWMNENLDSVYGARCQFEGTIGWQYPEISASAFLDWFEKYLLEIIGRKEPIHRIPVLPTNNIRRINRYTGKTIFWTGFCKEDEDVRLPLIMKTCGILPGRGVSKKIDYLVTGPHNGISGKYANKGKQAKALELGIPVIPTEIFISEVTESIN